MISSRAQRLKNEIIGRAVARPKYLMRKFIDIVMEIYRRPPSDYTDTDINSVLSDTGDFHQVGSIDEFEVYLRGDFSDQYSEPCFLLKSNGKPIGFVQLYPDQIKGLGEVQVTSAVGFIPSVRGRGLALKLYLFILNRGITLLSDHRHTPAGEQLWRQLAAAPEVDIRRLDTSNGAVLPGSLDGVWRDDFLNEPTSHIELDEYPHIRLIAQARR